MQRQRREPTDLQARALSMWERIAKHQLKEKMRAEDENRDLREQLESQLRLAKSLERILRKRPKALDSCPPSPAATARKRMCVDGSPEESVVFSTLLAGIALRRHEVDEVLRRCGVDEACDVKCAIRMKNDPQRGLYTEFVDNKVMPFSLQVMSDAMWQCMSLPYLKLHNGYYSAVSSTHDTIKSRSKVAFHVRKRDVLMNVHLTIQRFFETDRMLFLWESVSQKESDEVISGIVDIKSHETGWGVMIPVQHDEESDGNGNAGSRSSTIVRSCAHSSQHVEMDASEDQAHVGLVTDLMLSSYSQCISIVNQTIENAMVERTLTGI